MYLDQCTSEASVMDELGGLKLSRKLSRIGARNGAFRFIAVRQDKVE